MAKTVQQSVSDYLRGLKNLVSSKPVDGNGTELFTTSNPANVKFASSQSVKSVDGSGAELFTTGNPANVKFASPQTVVQNGSNYEASSGATLPSKVVAIGGSNGSTTAMSIFAPFNGDTMGTGDNKLATSNFNLAFNGSSWDRVRNNASGTLMSSGTRNVTVQSAQQINYNARGVMVTLVVTTASGTGGLSLRVYNVDPVNGTWFGVNANPTAVTANGTYTYLIYPNVASGGTQVTSSALTRQWICQVNHADSSNYTYLISYSYIL